MTLSVKLFYTTQVDAINEELPAKYSTPFGSTDIVSLYSSRLLQKIYA